MDPAESALWAGLARIPGSDAETALLARYAPIVAAAVRRARPKGAEWDDVAQDAMIGLWQAMKRFDPARGEFSTYATYRVRGAIVDGRRRRNHLSRAAQIKATRRAAEADLQYALTGRAERPSIPLRVDFDTISLSQSDSEKNSAFEREDLAALFRRRLPARQAEVMTRYYLRGETQPQIAASLAMSVCTISQALSWAVRTVCSDPVLLRAVAELREK